jgi:hypothetical protein
MAAGAVGHDGLAWSCLALLITHWLSLYDYPTIWFDARESVVMPFCALLERVFNQGI